MRRRSRYSLCVAGVMVFGLSHVATVRADLYEVTATPQATSGSFRHNVFHSATSNDGAGGNILGWFDLDTTHTSTWNSATGALDLHVQVFSDSALGTQIGTAHATSVSPTNDPLEASDFNSFDDSVIGTISWNVELTASGTFMTYMSDTFGSQPVGGWDSELAYIDHNYVTSIAGHVANSWDPSGGFVTLWGANGAHRGDGFFDGSNLGTDVVMKVAVVPAPAGFLLAALGCGLVGWIDRRNSFGS